MDASIKKYKAGDVKVTKNGNKLVCLGICGWTDLPVWVKEDIYKAGHKFSFPLKA